MPDGSLTQLEQAIAAYPGEFLPGFEGPWVDTRRNELEDRYLTLLETVVERSAEGPQRARARARYDAYIDLD